MNKRLLKWLTLVGLAVLVVGSWWLYANSGKDIDQMRARVAELQETGEAETEIARLQAQIDGRDGSRIYQGVVLAFVSAGLVGVAFVLLVLPSFAHRVTHAIYDSAEMVERDVMHDARSLLAQGNYQAAIQAFREAAAKDPLNRLPWVEIAKIQKEKLNDPAAAVQTIRYALESQEWEVNDAAYLLFRLAELYDEVDHNRAAAIAIMRQVIDEFPNTRHWANANHKLREWGVDKHGNVQEPGRPV